MHTWNLTVSFIGEKNIHTTKNKSIPHSKECTLTYDFPCEFLSILFYTDKTFYSLTLAPTKIVY